MLNKGKDKDWLVVRYKINECQRFERNLRNQDIQFYIPKIFINANKDSNKIKVLFPGYGFVRLAQTNLQALRNTPGLKNIIRFGDRFAIAKNSMISHFKELEYSSKIEPISVRQLSKGDEVHINSGPFEGCISKIIAVPSKDRITILISLLGANRTLTFSANNLQKK